MENDNDLHILRRLLNQSEQTSKNLTTFLQQAVYYTRKDGIETRKLQAVIGLLDQSEKASVHITTLLQKAQKAQRETPDNQARDVSRENIRLENNTSRETFEKMANPLPYDYGRNPSGSGLLTNSLPYDYGRNPSGSGLLTNSLPYDYGRNPSNSPVENLLQVVGLTNDDQEKRMSSRAGATLWRGNNHPCG